MTIQKGSLQQVSLFYALVLCARRPQEHSVVCCQDDVRASHWAHLAKKVMCDAVKATGVHWLFTLSLLRYEAYAAVQKTSPKTRQVVQLLELLED